MVVWNTYGIVHKHSGGRVEPFNVCWTKLLQTFGFQVPELARRFGLLGRLFALLLARRSVGGNATHVALQPLVNKLLVLVGLQHATLLPDHAHVEVNYIHSNYYYR